MKYHCIVIAFLALLACGVVVLFTGCTSVHSHSSALSISRTSLTCNTPSPFKAYDDEIVQSMTQHWYDRLATHSFKQSGTGLVVIVFHLHANGDVSDIAIQKSQVGEELSRCCLETVKDAAPFKPWPPDMRRMIGIDYREITFTFTYE